MKRRITTLFLCCVLLCLAVGCGKATEKSTAETVNADVVGNVEISVPETVTYTHVDVRL